MTSIPPIPSIHEQGRGRGLAASGPAPCSPRKKNQPSSWRLTYDAWEGLKGVPVYSADAVRLGIVAHVYHPLRYRLGEANHHYFLVRSGHRHLPFLHHELFVPETALARWSSQRIDLTVRSTQICRAGWEMKPPDLARFHRG